MSHTILRMPEVVRRTGLSNSTIYLMIQRGEFPKPAKITRHASGWPESVIDQWIEDRIKASVQA